MFGGQGLDAIEGKGQLNVHWLFAPQASVVVEDGDAIGRRDKVSSALRGHARDKIDDRLLRGPSIPRGKRIGLFSVSERESGTAAARREERQEGDQHDDATAPQYGMRRQIGLTRADGVCERLRKKGESPLCHA
jgi:hypothetical protein